MPKTIFRIIHELYSKLTETGTFWSKAFTPFGLLMYVVFYCEMYTQLVNYSSIILYNGAVNSNRYKTLAMYVYVNTTEIILLENFISSCVKCVSEVSKTKVYILGNWVL